MKIINLMKHNADIALANGKVISLEPSGTIAFCNVSTTEGKMLVTEHGDFLTTSKTKYLNIEGLPDPVDGVLYYVNMVTFNAACELGRTDVVMGDSGATATRNEKGHVSHINKLILA